MTDRRPNPPDKRANAPLWMAFALLCAVLLVGGIGYVVSFGVPGTTGGTSVSQQQTGGAPQPTRDIRSGDTLETTGYGAPQGARPPRQ